MIALLVAIVGLSAGFTIGACYEHLRRGGTIQRLVDETVAARAVSPDDITADAAEFSRILDTLLAPLPRRQDIR